MPLIWRYLLSQYLRIFFLALISFIAILMSVRLDDIASFASLGTAQSRLLLFILYQIPYIIPIAVPVSSLLAGLLTFSRLSSTSELTAFRSSGISLRQITSPILMAAVVLSLLNFFLVSEVSTSSNLQGKKLLRDSMAINPIVLLQKAKIGHLQNAYFQMDPIKNGEAAKDLFIVLKNKGTKRLHLFVAKSVFMQNQELQMEDVSLISASPSTNGMYDNLMIENQKSGFTNASSFAKIFFQSGWKISNDHLKFSLLKIKIKKLLQANQGGSSQKELNKCYSDIARRVSLGLSVLTFTLLGASFGIDISRNVKKKSLFIVFIAGSVSLILFFVAKEFVHIFWLGCLLFLLPHLINTSLSVWKFKSISRGIE